MKRPVLRIVTPVLMAIGLLVSPAAMGNAFAAGEGPVDPATMDHVLSCDDGTCALNVDLGAEMPAWLPATSFALTVLEDNLSLLPDGAGISVSDGLTLDMPIGNLELTEAEITLTMGEDGSVESFYGTAELPKPSLGLFGKPSSRKPIATAIGYDTASELPMVNAPLESSRKYLFFDLASGTELSAAVEDGDDGTLWLTIPEGQRATIVIDPQERFAYIDGNVTLRYSGTMAFLSQILDPAETLDLFSGELPLRHQATVHLTGVIADDLTESSLEFAGRYAVDGGRLGEWLKITGEPLALEGGMLISDEGVLGTGIVKSTLFPENVWDGAVQAQVFVPFSAEVEDAYVALDSRLSIPFANMSMDAYAMFDGGMDVVAESSFVGPWMDSEGDSIAAIEADESVEIVEAVAKVTDEEIAAEANQLSQMWDATMGGVQTGLAATREPVGAATDWVRDTAGSGFESASGGVEWTIDIASSTWCSTTGFCGGRDDGSVTETAMK